jgi:hypothetical protein
MFALGLLICTPALEAATIAEKTAGLQRIPGYFALYLD